MPRLVIQSDVLGRCTKTVVPTENPLVLSTLKLRAPIGT